MRAVRHAHPLQASLRSLVRGADIAVRVRCRSWSNAQHARSDAPRDCAYAQGAPSSLRQTRATHGEVAHQRGLGVGDVMSLNLFAWGACGGSATQLRREAAMTCGNRHSSGRMPGMDVDRARTSTCRAHLSTSSARPHHRQTRVCTRSAVGSSHATVWWALLGLEGGISSCSGGLCGTRGLSYT